MMEKKAILLEDRRSAELREELEREDELTDISTYLQHTCCRWRTKEKEKSKRAVKELLKC